MRNSRLLDAIKFFTPVSRSERIHSNFVFRLSYCGLSDLKAASCVGVDIEQVYAWDDGEEIPFSVRKVWLYESGRELPEYSGFSEWSFKSGRLSTPDGALYTERQLKVALFLLDQQDVR